MSNESQSLRGVARLSFWLVAYVFIMELMEALIDKNPKTYDYLEVPNQGLAFLGFFIRSRKIHFRGCLASLGNDEILECFCIKRQDLGLSLIIVIDACIKSKSLCYN